MTGLGDWARALARASYGIELTPGRAAELVAELKRLDGAAREAPAATGLEVEPGAGFRRTLVALAGDRPYPPRASARRADAARPGGPLAGVPLAHKDMFDRAGRVSTCGARMRLRPAAATATVLARLDPAGALEIGTLNMSG